MRFYENSFPRKAFPQNAFHEMQEKHNGEKIKESKLNILSMGRIARQQLLDISADYLTNNIGV